MALGAVTMSVTEFGFAFEARFTLSAACLCFALYTYAVSFAAARTTLEAFTISPAFSFTAFCANAVSVAAACEGALWADAPSHAILF